MSIKITCIAAGLLFWGSILQSVIPNDNTVVSPLNSVPQVLEAAQPVLTLNGPILAYKGIASGSDEAESKVGGGQPAAPLKPPGEPMEYQPFYPDRWQAKNQSTKLFPWEGERVVLLTTTADLDPKTVATFLERLDVGWKLYADLVGQAKRGSTTSA